MLLAQRPRAGHARRASTSRSTTARRRARVTHRARVARRRPAARRPHGAAEGADAQLPRRGEDLDRPDRDPGQRVRAALVLVTDGRQLNAIEQRELRRSLQPQSVAQMIRVLNDTRRNNRIYVRLLTGTPGAVVNGEALTVAAAVGARRCSKAIATAAASRRSAAPPSASGSCRWIRRSPARALLTIDVEARAGRPVASRVSLSANVHSCQNSRAGRAPVVPRACLAAAACGACLSRRRRPTFWTVSTQADFLKGDVEDLSIDSDGRVFLGPVRVARRRNRRAVSLDRARRQPTARCGPAAATKGKVLKVAKDGKLSTFFDAAELEVHALAAGAERRPLRRRPRPTARSTRSPPTARRRRSSIRTTSTSGRSRSTSPATSSPRPATRASSTRSRPTARARASTRPTPRNVVSLAFDQDRRPDRRHRIARARLPHRQRPARRSCCSIRRSARSTRCASPTTGRSTRRR